MVVSCCVVHLSVDSSLWKIRNETNIAKNMREDQFTSFRKKQAQRVERNIKIIGKWNTVIHQRKKNSVRCRARNVDMGSLVFEVNALTIVLALSVENLR